MLAAGRSSRMERWKMTLPCADSTVIERSVGAALEVCRRVILVSGYRAEELKTLFQGRDRLELVVNPDYEDGMFCSVQCGCVQVRTPRFFLALGDMPLVRPEVYRILLRFPEIEAIIPKYRGKKGHPLLLSAEVARAVGSFERSGTLREVLAAFPALTVPVDDDHILHDIDTTEDYRATIEDPP